MDKPLKIIHWNRNGVLQKSNELQAFISKNKIDIVLISETKLKPIDRLKLTNFVTYRL